MIIIIRGYQYLISPYLAPSCRYTPSCSEYAIEAFQRFGFFRGLNLSVRRIVSCNPWHHGGHDPVPMIHYNKSSQKNKHTIIKK